MKEEFVRKVDCPECDKTDMYSHEFVEHGATEHPNDYPFSGMFPEYVICTDGTAHDDVTAVYMRIDGDNGPFWIAWDDRDYVDKTYPRELMLHDWKPVLRENTPFPRFEE